MIFVTGGTGLVGSHLLYDLVKRGKPVKALRRKGSDVEETRRTFSYYSENANELFSRIEWIEGDLSDIFSLAEAMEGITEVYHCAAVVSMDPKDGKKMIHTNVTGTANVVNVALEKNIRKLCHVSSVASLGIEKGKEITEETQWNDESNSSAYAISKYLSENEVWRASQEGLRTIIVNPSIVIGPGNWRRSSGLAFQTASKGLTWYSSGGMGYVDVRDVVKIMTGLMEREVLNEKFIVSSENISFRDFFGLVHISLGKPVPNKKAGKFILGLGWRVDKFQSIFTGSPHYLTKDIARYASISLSYSNKKIKNLLGTDFIPVAEAVKNTSRHFLSNGSMQDKIPYLIPG